jgi:heme exporter protein D
MLELTVLLLILLADSPVSSNDALEKDVASEDSKEEKMDKAKRATG